MTDEDVHMHVKLWQSYSQYSVSDVTASHNPKNKSKQSPTRRSSVGDLSWSHT